jgi:opacity protein-like surface antigen
MKRHYLASLALCGVVAFASDAGAQTMGWGNTGYISINGLYQATPITFTTTARPEVNQEPGEVTTGHRIAPGPVFDFTASGRAKGRFGVIYSVSYRKLTELGEVTAALPHPFYFNQPRVVAGQASLKREDLALHLAGQYMLPVSENVQVSLFGGPTYFRVTQDMVGGVSTEDAYPFDQVQYVSAAVTKEHGSHVGYNAGGDVAVFFTPTLGVGMMVRYSQASVQMPSPEGGTSAVKVGGLQTGAGLRVKF